MMVALRHISHPAEQASLAALVRQVLPAGATFGIADPVAAPLGLMPEEELAIRRAVPARAAEFAAGRRAARAAMAALGHLPRAIPRTADRAPVWPEGLTGSITHTRQDCLAVMAPASACAALGIDLEDRAPLPPDLLETVTTPTERAWLADSRASLTDLDAGTLARMIFSAKEAAYKAQYALSATLLGFADMEVTPHTAAGTFEARLTRDAGPFARGHVFHGRLATDNRRILTALALPATDRHRTMPRHPSRATAAQRTKP